MTTATNTNVAKSTTPGRPLPEQVVVRLELTPESKEQVVAVSDRLGMTQIATLSRLVEWFAGQSPEVQALVNGGGDASRPVLERMAGGGPS